MAVEGIWGGHMIAATQQQLGASGGMLPPFPPEIFSLTSPFKTSFVPKLATILTRTSQYSSYALDSLGHRLGGGDYFTERSRTERNGIRSKIRNGTGLKCGTAKSRNMEGGAVTASA